jgi:chaperonin GroES
VKAKKSAKAASRRPATKRPAGRGSSRPAPGAPPRPSARSGEKGAPPSGGRTVPGAVAKKTSGGEITTAQQTGGQLMANVKPLRDRVLVRRIEEAEQKVGGIIIPDTAKEKPLQAEVIAVGSGRLLENGQKVELTLKPGDKVLIGKWSGTEVKIDDEELLILKEDEILGILS